MVKGRDSLKGKGIVAFTLVAFFALTLGCATTERTYQGAAVGGASGASIGALIDRHNRWRGAVLGAAIGSVVGGTLTEISSRASREAAAENRTVVYRNPAQGTVVETSPLPQNNASTHCHKVRRRIWKNGALIKDTVEEVCESDKTVGSYESY